VPYQTFEAADGWINLGVANDDLWQRFCKAAERPDLAADPRYLKAADRVRNRDQLVPLVADLVKSRTRDDWMNRLEAAGGVPAGAIRTVGEVCESDLLAARDMIAAMPHASAGVVKTVKNAVRLSGTPLDAYVAPPQLGEHTSEVLTGLLGYSAAEVEKLKNDGAI
jgi:formyl-CoA transferase